MHARLSPLASWADQLDLAMADYLDVLGPDAHIVIWMPQHCCLEILS